MIDLIRELSAISGISGDEGRVAAYITNCIKDHCEYRIDGLGNVIAHKKGAAPAAKALMLSAHMDEVGMIVTSISEEGLLKLATVGGVDASVIAGRRVFVGDHQIPGVVGLRPIHLIETAEREKSLKLDELMVEIGAVDKADAQKLVSPGIVLSLPPSLIGWAPKPSAARRWTTGQAVLCSYGSFSRPCPMTVTLLLPCRKKSAVSAEKPPHSPCGPTWGWWWKPPRPPTSPAPLPANEFARWARVR